MYLPERSHLRQWELKMYGVNDLIEGVHLPWQTWQSRLSNTDHMLETEVLYMKRAYQ